MTDIPTDTSWFYTQAGQRKGPVAAAEIHALLADKTIDAETPVWRKGLPDWLPLSKSELGAALSDEPPPVAAAHINNGYVWALAVAPLAYFVIEAMILGYQLKTPYEDHQLSSALLWIIPAAANAILCLLDQQQLKAAGYNSAWITFFALLLAPVYLFVRAQRLRQTPTYGFVWVATFVVSILLRAA